MQGRLGCLVPGRIPSARGLKGVVSARGLSSLGGRFFNYAWQSLLYRTLPPPFRPQLTVLTSPRPFNPR